MRMATCHRDRKHKAKGLCDLCYQRYRYNNDQRVREVQLNNSRQWGAVNKDRKAATSRHYRYGLTPTQYAALLLYCAGKCCLCGGEMKKPHVDHCHKTGRVRGLLHDGCNTYLGMYEKGEQGIVSARCEEYLSRPALEFLAP